MADDLSGALLGLRAWRASRRGLLASLIFAGNTVTNSGGPAPATRLGYVLNSAAPPAAVTGAVNGTPDFASANQAAR